MKNISRPVSWSTPNWVKNFSSWMFGFTDSDGRELEEPSDERSGYDYGNEPEGSPDHPQFVSDEQREIDRECLANL